MVIAVSGFLSEGSDHKNEWSGLIEANKDIPIYCYHWAAKDYTALLNPVKNMISLRSFLSLKDYFNKISVLAAGFSIAYGYSQVFWESVDYARQSGKLLAHAIMQQYPFMNQSITLVGFSLGTQVIYSCLEELRACDEFNASKFLYLLL